jgi:uncharacterized protein YqeY
MAETLKERLRHDLNEARKARDREHTELLTTTISEVRNKEIEVGHELSDEEVVGVLATAIKRRREAAEQMRAGHREELAQKEEREAAALQAYMPAALTEADVRALVQAAIAGGANNLGLVMREISPRIKGRFDGKEANRIAREVLGA